MTKQNLIRILCGLMFLIFLCPFFQMCSDESYLVKVTKDEPQETVKKEVPVLNAYELSVFKNYDLNNFWWPELLFTVIILSSLTIFILSMRGHYFGLRFLCYLNLIIALAYLSLMLYAQVLDDIIQIKYGYYLFILNTIAIIVLSKRIDPYGDN